MEEGTPIFEAFTQNVGDEGPSQPLIRKLMSIVLPPHPPTRDQRASGFFQAQSPPPFYVAEASTSREVPPEAAEDIAETVGCPVEDMENVVQSGFRFAGADGCNDSPQAENYFTESRLPVDLADKVPIDFLHAINNVLDTKVIPTRRSHHHGRRRNRARARHRDQVSAFPGLATASETPQVAPDFGQEMIMRRLDRLEEICSRTETYMHLVLGTMEKRLQLLETDAMSTQRSTQEASCSPRYPGTGGIYRETGTIVTPEMLLVQSPRPDRPFLATTVVSSDVQIPPSPFEDARVCLSPVDVLPSPAAILTAPLTSEVPGFEFPFSGSQEVSHPQTEAGEASTATGPPVTASQDQPSSLDEGGEKPQMTAIAVFSVGSDATTGTHENQVDALWSEPVVAWENDGFPYLRPAYQISEPPLRDTTVLTWDSAKYFTPESISSEEEHGMSSSSDDAFSFYNLEDSPGEGPSNFHQRHHAEVQRREETMLEEISNILKNICNNLEVLKSPEQTDTSPLESSPSTLESCSHCRNQGRQRPEAVVQVMAGKDEEEIASVLEGMFTRLTFSPQAEDALVNVLPTSGEETREDLASSAPYQELPQDESVGEESRGKKERCLEIFSSSAPTPKVSLSFMKDEGVESPSSSQDMSVKFEVPTDSGTSPVTLHVAIVPKEMKKREDDSERVAQDICVSVEGPYQDPVICENEYSARQSVPDSRETVTVTKDKLTLTEDIAADYTLKVVPRTDRQQETGSSEQIPVALREDENTLINNEAVSSIVHELCFSVEVPSAERDSKEEQEFPLQIGLGLTAGSKPIPSSGTDLVPLSLEGTSSSQPDQLASVVLNLGGFKKAKKSEEQVHEEHDIDGPLSFNWEGIPARGECQDIPCLLKVADRKTVGDEEIASVHQEVCLSVEVPASLETKTEGESSGVQVGVVVKTVPTRRDDECSNVISCVEIPEEQPFERAPLTEMPERQTEAGQEELVPLKAALDGNDFKIITEVDVVDAMVAPPPSPVEGAPETDEYLFKEEEKKPATGDEWVIDSSFLPKEKDNVDTVQGEAKVPKPVLKGMTPTDFIRGNLNFDGKACLLSVSADDIWTPEDMCQAPVMRKQLRDPRTDLKKTGEVPLPQNDITAWLGDVLPDGVKPAGLGRSRAFPAFGFRGVRQPEATSNKVPGPPAGFGFSQRVRPAAGVSVLGFRNLQQPKTSTSEQPQVQPLEPVFGFRSLDRKSSDKPPLPPGTRKPNISVNIPVADQTSTDWDSSLSVVSRGPASETRRNLSQEEQPPKQRVPDSPGARSCIIDGELSKAAVESSTSTTATTPAIVTALDQEQQQGGRPEAESSTSVVTIGELRCKTALDLLDAAASEDESGDSQGWAGVLPLEGGDGEDAFFDALQCSDRHGNQNKNLRRSLKDKLWSRLSCYGVGLPDSDSSDAPRHPERL